MKRILMTIPVDREVFKVDPPVLEIDPATEALAFHVVWDTDAWQQVRVGAWSDADGGTPVDTKPKELVFDWADECPQAVSFLIPEGKRLSAIKYSVEYKRGADRVVFDPVILLKKR